MSQKYTEVEWTDETPTEPGTLINKARLDQMQSAHHYADGFEEVDTAPTTDPGVDYHKVVYCTADSTFYRWDGAQWTKDIDDETKALLLAHEADHANPHVVTKAQVGLGDVVDKGMDDAPTDSSDNYVKSGGVKTALDGKLDIIPTTSGTYFYAQQSTGPTRYAGTSNAQMGTTTVVLRDANGRFSVEDPTGASNAANKRYVDNSLVDKLDDSQLVTSWGSPVSDSKIASEKLTKDTLDTKADTTALTDGSVTKVGTANVGSDTKPIKLVAGVPTAVTNTLIDDTSTQTINATKIFSHTAATTVDGNNPKGAVEKLTNITVNSTTANRYFYLAGARDSADKLLAGINMRYNANGDVHFALATSDSAGELTAQEIARFYRSTGTWGSVLVSDALDNYAPMVRTTGNQDIAGTKTFTGQLWVRNTIRCAPSSNIRRGLVTLKSNDSSTELYYIGNTDDAGDLRITYVPTAKELLQISNAGVIKAPNQRSYDAANTEDVVTIGTLDAYTPMVRTSGNQAPITGIKRTAMMNNNFCEVDGFTTSNSGWHKVFVITSTQRWIGKLTIARVSNGFGLSRTSYKEILIEIETSSAANMFWITNVGASVSVILTFNGTVWEVWANADAYIRTYFQLDTLCYTWKDTDAEYKLNSTWLTVVTKPVSTDYNVYIDTITTPS